MKQTYVPVTLDQYLNESKTITLKRGYGERKPVVVGSTAPIRNQILSYVAENQRVAKTDLKRFIAGLNEGSKNPNASAIMWLKRNSHFFVTESKEGQTFFKLSPIGRRLADRFVQAPSTTLSEQKKNKDDYDFVDTKKGYPRKGLYDVSEEEEDKKEECSETVTESRKAKIEAIIERIRSKRAQELREGKEESLEEEAKFMGKDPLAGIEKSKKKLGGKLDKNLHNQLEDSQEKDENELSKFPEEKAKKKINEAEEEKPDEEDELSFDDLDLGDEEEKKEEKPAEGEEKPEEKEEEKPDEGEEDKVEITEFIITVTNAEEAIKELDELGVPAEKVEDEEEKEEGEEEKEEGEEKEEEGEEKEKEGEEKEEDSLNLGEAAEGEEPEAEEKIKVSVDYWEPLKKWLEEKGVNIEELFGGEIEIEEEPEGEETPDEGEEDDFSLDLGDETPDEGEGEGADDFSLDLEETTEAPTVEEQPGSFMDKVADKVADKILNK